MASVATANHQHVVTSDAQRGELTHGSIREHAVTDHKITGKNYRITVIGQQHLRHHAAQHPDKPGDITCPMTTHGTAARLGDRL